MQFIDAHCHLTDDRVWQQSRSLIGKAQAAGVVKFKLGGLYPDEWTRQSELANEFPGIVFTSFGLHPWWIEKLNRKEIEAVLKILESKLDEAGSIGETGLDYFPKRDAARFGDQEFAFRQQLRLAKRAEKPVVLHVVKAHQEAIRIIHEEQASHLRFQVHSYSGSAEIAREWIKLGAYLSFSGGILRGQGPKLAETLINTPLGQILLETDAPDQSWVPGRPNEPAYVSEVYQKAAQVLNLPLETLAEIVAENFARFA